MLVLDIGVFEGCSEQPNLTMPKMRAVQIAAPNGPLELVEREIPEPGPGLVRIKVQACGICHSDSVVKEGHWPGLKYPRVPGHEVVGIVDAIGAGVLQWKPGQHVGVGWHGGHCGFCRKGWYSGTAVDSQERASVHQCALGRALDE